MEMKCKHLLAVIFILAFVMKINAQEVPQIPTPVELILGNERFGLQTLVTKNFPDSKRFSFLSVVNFESDYSQNNNNLDFFNSSQISFDIYKGFGISSGINVTKAAGLSPALGLQYVFANPTWFFVATPSLIFSTGKSASFLSILEYKPKLTNQLKLYSRIQGLYNHNITLSTHERSYLQLRIGLGYKKYQFGLASNLDYFGPNRFFKDNYGVFIRANL